MTERTSTNAIGGDESRAVSPIVSVVLLIALTVCLAIVVAIGVGAWSPGTPGPTATFELTADGDNSTVMVEHVAGDAIDVEALSVTISVNETTLSAQPPVPFAGAGGFDGTPHGPFNSKADPEWTPGERAGVSVAETNAPTVTAGDSVTVTLTVDGRRVAELETIAT